MEIEALTTPCDESPRAAGDHIPDHFALPVGGEVLEDARVGDRLFGRRLWCGGRRGFGRSAGRSVQWRRAGGRRW